MKPSHFIPVYVYKRSHRLQVLQFTCAQEQRRMKAFGMFQLLLLLWSVITDQTEADTRLAERQDINAVLRELTASLAEQKVQIQYLQKENQENAVKLKELEMQKTEVEKMREQLKVTQVAFSVSLYMNGHETLGPFGSHTTLIFRRIATNIGNAYNVDTGIFIAPVRGAYHFEWHIGAHGHGHQATGAVLVKNSEHIFIAYEHQPSHFASASNSATLLLEADDVVFLRLWAHTKVFDNINRHSTFSGRLLFPM